MLNESSIGGNRATGTSSTGGGIVATNVTIKNSTVTGNSATGKGGGIYAGDYANIDKSTVSNNDSANSGGGMYVFFGRIEITQSTFSMNTAADNGGGIYSGFNTTLIQSTVSQNSAGESGGGLFVEGGTLTLDHTIVARNTAGAGIGRDLTGLLGLIIDAQYSLIGSNANTGLAVAPVGSPDANGNLIGGALLGTVINPLLGPLADNGGFTLPDGSHILTHALLAGSPAIDAGDPSAMAGVGGVPVSDQRGVPFTRVYGGRIDMGAVETLPVGFLPGDYNANGIVDTADYTVWRDQLGGGPHPLDNSRPLPEGEVVWSADGNGDGVVNEFDYELWKSNFGSTLSAPGQGAGSKEQGINAATTLAEPVAPGEAATHVAESLRDSEMAEMTVSERLSHVNGKPPADPETGYPAGVVGRWRHRVPVDAAVRQDRLLEAWLTARDPAGRQQQATEARTSLATALAEPVAHKANVAAEALACALESIADLRLMIGD